MLSEWPTTFWLDLRPNTANVTRNPDQVDHGHKGKLATVLLKEHSDKMSPNDCYTQKAGPCSVHLREASSCSGWQLTQRNTDGQNSRPWSREWTVFIRPSLSGLEDAFLYKRRWRSLRAGVVDNSKDATSSATMCTGPAQISTKYQEEFRDEDVCCIDFLK